MKRTIRFTLTGSMQPIFFNRFIKDSADELGIKGFVRKLDDGRMEIFAEGDLEPMVKMSEICRKGSPHSFIRSVDEKEEKFQDLKDFRIINF